ncbi:MAG TPA: hypothetical protein VL921_12745, partial [Candidatus Udaeobacter sp.]|nr:hypothetical protein [Candidatus Udaeobacter sp.]
GEPGSANFFVSSKGERKEIEVPYVNAYTAQADHLARAIKGETTLQFGSADALSNMKVIDACLLSARGRTRIIL